ncbi:hypothetical protein GOP47_0012817 [Adiantum capillus-veneris]|uniref:Uncharacterized protein n=1 Tax=Adiantum capillus-veneris TaxID=13818 RepID=A0A9D4URL9_ADICA|nr:hypothetical protein GOP47_0012817 [Adiantum capillus-veneris]
MYQITPFDLDDEDVDPCIPIEVTLDKVPTYALVDSGAHYNYVTYNFFNQLTGVQLVPEFRCCESFNNAIIITKGWAEIPLYINGLLCTHQFHVCDVQDDYSPIIFGTTWQRRYNAYLHWSGNQMYFQAEGKVSKVLFASEEEVPHQQLRENNQKFLPPPPVAVSTKLYNRHNQRKLLMLHGRSALKNQCHNLHFLTPKKGLNINPEFHSYLAQHTSKFGGQNNQIHNLHRQSLANNFSGKRSHH